MINFVDLRRHLRFALIKKGPILDLGSGNNPFWRANVLMDRYIDNDAQRPGKLVADRSLVCGDIHALPFIDDAFVFIFCSHVLEHTKYPEKAISEMLRVGKSGYIDVPSEIHEYIDLDFPFHRWVISLENNTLFFREKSKSVHEHPLVKALRNRNNQTAIYLKKYHDKVSFIRIYWNNDTKFSVERCADPIEDFLMEDNYSGRTETYEDNNNIKIKTKIKKLLSIIYHFHITLADILACPFCKKKVLWENNRILCNSCEISFPVIKNIPIMLKESAKSL